MDTHNGPIGFQLFGGVKVFHASDHREIKLTRITQQFLAYLLLERHRLHNRDTLANLFWGEYSVQHARNCLNTTLWRLRQAFEKDGIQATEYIISTQSGEIGFNHEGDYWLDVAVFDNSLLPILKRQVSEVLPRDAHTLEECLEQYSGELLDGFYEDWALRAREQKRLLFLDGLSFLMKYFQHHGMLEKSVEVGQKILNMDPLREEVHREIIKIYADLGKRSLAVRQYEICRRRLYEELGINPMPETDALVNSLTQDRKDPHPAQNEKEPMNLEQAILQLRQANKNFKLAHKQYQAALKYLEIYSEAQERKHSKYG